MSLLPTSKNTSGDYAMHRPNNQVAPRISYSEQKIKASARVVYKLTQERADRLRAQWDSMGSDGDAVDGLLVCLIKYGLSHIEIKSFLPVGGYRLSRLKKVYVYNKGKSERKKLVMPSIN